MIHIMSTLLRLITFLLLLSFVVKNLGTATIHYYLGFEWELPVVVILFICFFAGSVFGYSSCLVQKIQNRK